MIRIQGQSPIGLSSVDHGAPWLAALLRRLVQDWRLPVGGLAWADPFQGRQDPVVDWWVEALTKLLEYGVSGAAVAVGWSQYLNQLLDNVLGVRIPDVLAQSPEGGGLINLPAVVLIALCALLLIRGGRASRPRSTRSWW